MVYLTFFLLGCVLVLILMSTPLYDEIEMRIKNRDWSGAKLKKAHADLRKSIEEYGPITVEDLERAGPMFQNKPK